MTCDKIPLIDNSWGALTSENHQQKHGDHSGHHCQIFATESLVELSKKVDNAQAVG
jgi:hypothetical protein